MFATLIIALIVILTIGSCVKRLMDLQGVPVLFWLAAVICAAAPSYVGWTVLQPGDPVATASVKGLDQVVEFDVPQGHSIMVTAVLADIDENDNSVNSGKTVYNLNVEGQGWAQAASGTMKRKSAKGGPDIDIIDGQGVSSGSQKRSGRLGEDLQDRIDLDGSGTVKLTVTNWQGEAAESLTLDVVKAPPPASWMWSIVVVVALLGIILEVKYDADRVAGDLGFLACYAVFLRDGVTPLDDFQRVAYAALPAALIGWLVIAGVAWLAVKYSHTKADAEEKKKDEEEVQAEPDEEDADPRSRRRRRRRKSVKSDPE